jgi:nitrite reductase/ring-hydroxylating ferredoxin subunit
VGEFPPGSARELRLAGREIAVWRTRDGEVHALDARCLHVGGPLADGIVDGWCVECPWHGWRYDLLTGRRKTAHGDAEGVRAYAAWVDGDLVCVEVPLEGDVPLSDGCRSPR